MFVFIRNMARSWLDAKEFNTIIGIDFVVKFNVGCYRSIVLCEQGYGQTEGTPGGNIQSKVHNKYIHQHTVWVSMYPSMYNQVDTGILDWRATVTTPDGR